MGLSATELNQLLSSVDNFRVDAESTRLLRIVVGSTETARHFLDALLARQSASGNVDTSAVISVMRILEGLAESEKLVSSILMAHLYPIADALYMHDICNSIDLSATDCD